MGIDKKARVKNRIRVHYAVHVAYDVCWIGYLPGIREQRYIND